MDDTPLKLYGICMLEHFSSQVGACDGVREIKTGGGLEDNDGFGFVCKPHIIPR